MQFIAFRKNFAGLRAGLRAGSLTVAQGCCYAAHQCVMATGTRPRAGSFVAVLGMVCSRARAGAVGCDLCRRRLFLRHNPWQPRLAIDVQWRDAPCDSTVLISRVGRERWRIRDENLPHTRRDCDDLYSEQSIVDSSSKSTKVITCTFSRVRKWRSTSSKMMPVVKA